MILRWLFILCSGLYISVWAAPPAFEISDDSSRVQFVAYKPNLVVRLTATVNHPILIIPDPSERLDGVAIGDARGWEVVKDGSKLFVRALPEAVETTLIITSSKRSYIFELTPLSGLNKRGNLQNIAKIVFTYEAPAAASPSSPPPSPLTAALAKNKRNYKYSMQIVSNNEQIAPDEVFDDGVFTYFKFPREQQVPAIYKSWAGSKEEWLFDYHVEDEYVVLHGISSSWNLRLNESIVGVFKENYIQGQGEKVDGTVLLDYKRVDK